MVIFIDKCRQIKDEDNHKTFWVKGTVDDERFEVTVMPYCGEYNYFIYPSTLGDDDEPLQGVIGEHFRDTNTDVGVVGR